MNIMGIAGIAVCAAVVAAMLKRYHQEYSIIIGIAAGVVILLEVFGSLTPVLKQVGGLLSSSGLSSQYAVILLKTLGICFLAQFAADSCRDAGESSLASQVELAGKIAIVILSLPLFQKIASTALSLIGG